MPESLAESLFFSPPCCCDCTPANIFLGGVWPSSLQVDFSDFVKAQLGVTEPVGIQDQHPSWGPLPPVNKYLNGVEAEPADCVPSFIATFASHNYPTGPVIGGPSPQQGTCGNAWLASLGETGVAHNGHALTGGGTSPPCALRYSFTGTAHSFTRRFAVYDGSGDPWDPASYGYEDITRSATYWARLTISLLSTGRRIMRIDVGTGSVGVLGAPSELASSDYGFADLGSEPLDPGGSFTGAMVLGLGYASKRFPKPTEPLWVSGDCSRADPTGCFAQTPGTFTATGLP